MEIRLQIVRALPLVPWSARERARAVEIVLVSGAGDVEDLARQAGIPFWASKPIGRSELMDLLCRVGLVVTLDDPRA